MSDTINHTDTCIDRSTCEGMIAARDAVIHDQSAEIGRLQRLCAQAFEIAAKAVGSDYRNIGVVQARADHYQQLLAELRDKFDCVFCPHCKEEVPTEGDS